VLLLSGIDGFESVSELNLLNGRSFSTKSFRLLRLVNVAWSAEAISTAVNLNFLD
jgi:hypothetical protein